MELEQQLRAALAPCEPGPQPLATVMARLSGSARPPRRNRTILFGTLFAVVAAASMLLLRLTPGPAPAVAAAVPVATPGPSSALDDSPPSVVAEAKAPPVAEKNEPMPSTTVKPFTVRVLPLQNDAATPASRQAVESFQAALLDDLRRVPGLVLVTAESTSYAPDAPTDYRLTLRGSGQAAEKFVVMLRAESLERHITLPIELSGDVTATCATAGTTGCGDPAAMAGLGLQLLRKNVFPADPVAPQESRAKFLNTSLDASARLGALIDMRMENMITTRFRPQGTGTVSQDPQIIRGLVDLGTTVTDPGIRAEVWRTVRGMHITDLIPSLSDALRTDRDGSVRVEAAATLATDFASDQQVDAVLEVAAKEDPRPMVRALARRGLQGESAWTDYVVSSLKDTSLPPSERIEALFFTMNTSDRTVDIGKLLDDDASIKAFVDAFSRVQASAPEVELPNTVLLSHLGSINHPAVTGLLLDTLGHTVQPAVRQNIVSQLVRHASEERVQAALLKVSVEDADPELREMAAKALKP